MTARRLEPGAFPLYALDYLGFLGVCVGRRGGFRLAAHGLGFPAPVRAAVGAAVLPHRRQARVPAVRDDLATRLQELFRMLVAPEDAVPFHTQVDHPADAALDRTTAQRDSQPAERRVFQTACFPVLTQVRDLGLQILVLRIRGGTLRQFVHHPLPLAVAQPCAMLAILRQSLRVAQAQGRQRP